MRCCRNCNRAKHGGFKEKCFAFLRAADCRPYGKYGQIGAKADRFICKTVFRCAKSKIIFIKSLNNKIQFPLCFVLAAACLRSPTFAQRIQRLINLCPTAKNRQNPSKVCRFSFFIRKCALLLNPPSVFKVFGYYALFKEAYGFFKSLVLAH